MSKAKKKRKHLIRNGGLDPELFRADPVDISTHVRKMPTLQERQERKMKKHTKKREM